MNDEINLPKIFFESGWLIDLGWDFKNPDQPIADEALPLVKKLFQPFESLWADEGTLLMIETCRILNKPWIRRELTCTLTVHPEMSSNSHPLMINVRPYYKTKEFTLELREEFIDTLYHELLHRMLDDHWAKNLETGEHPFAMLEKYKEENIFIHAHLHLYAVQEAVYKNLGKELFWNNIKKRVQNESYQRALKIVEYEGFQNFLNDLIH